MPIRGELAYVNWFDASQAGGERAASDAVAQWAWEHVRKDRDDIHIQPGPGRVLESIVGHRLARLIEAVLLLH
jgi:hypothetical protein